MKIFACVATAAALEAEISGLLIGSGTNVPRQCGQVGSVDACNTNDMKNADILQVAQPDAGSRIPTVSLDDHGAETAKRLLDATETTSAVKVTARGRIVGDTLKATGLSECFGVCEGCQGDCPPAAPAQVRVLAPGAAPTPSPTPATTVTTSAGPTPTAAPNVAEQTTAAAGDAGEGTSTTGAGAMAGATVALVGAVALFM
eukprot:CAMPEP_0204371868 /NCGR_PEP_ID=MMETSP0469-20131031/46829_1 /ASSEMBLY_ACC=CAM_ASM_000384 /TAXON_ID=2969 /ORGANISM="Oxyrrhis marina" /LENGTH=200 /DNA_ID=CAMNT_0051362049 /DNA_START=34 /DNA_END=636 /DNA_ORIENTATION=+